MHKTTIGILLLVTVYGPGCDKRSGSQQEQIPTSVEVSSSETIHLGPESKEEAIAIAKTYMHAHHADKDISQEKPSAQYFAKAAHDGHPLWVIGFSIPRESDEKSIRTHYTFGLWVRENGHVENTMVQSP
jgi:hypothetical protein